MLKMRNTAIVYKGINYSVSVPAKHHCASTHNELKQWDRNNYLQLVCKAEHVEHTHVLSLT